MGEISGAVIVIIKTEEDLYIFCEGKRRNTEDKAINTDESLVSVIINRVMPYQSLEEIR
jgi:hypothetical protein